MTDAENERLKAEVTQLRDEIISLSERLHEAKAEIEELQGQVADEEGVIAAIDVLKFLSVRPVGRLTPSIPDCPASQRALLALFDAAGVAP